MDRTTCVLNGVGHFDVAGTDLAKLARFYGDVFGWQIVNKGPGYSLAETPEGSANGALIEAEESSLTVGITVPDVRKTLEAALAAGGAVVMPATDNGWVTKAQVQDPAGNLLSLIQA